MQYCGGIDSQTTRDAEVQAYRTANSNLQLEDVPFRSQGVTPLCDMSTGKARPLVPISWRRQIFDTIHGLSHPSVRATRKLISIKFVWNGLQKQIGFEPNNVLSARPPKYRLISNPLLSSSQYLSADSTTYMLTL